MNLRHVLVGFGSRREFQHNNNNNDDSDDDVCVCEGVVEVLLKGRTHKNWRIYTGGRVLGAGFWEETSLARSPSIPICICYYCCAALDLEAQFRSVCGTCCWATHGLTREIIRLVPISVITYANTKYKLLEFRLSGARNVYIEVGIQMLKNVRIHLKNIA